MAIFARCICAHLSCTPRLSFDEERMILDTDVRLICVPRIESETIIFYRSDREPASNVLDCRRKWRRSSSCLKIYGILPDGDSCFMNDRNFDAAASDIIADR